ncbi:MAG: hypothetical protein MI806_18380 [Minwuiales bacterium]|nr:hypothetical protein [Minwuiales bacterium]
MPVVADFTVIVGDTPVTIGDNRPVYEKNFNTGGRFPTDALLMFNVRHLTHTHRNVVVRVNNQEVGRIFPYSGRNEDANNWYTQTIVLNPGQLRDGDNELQIDAVRLDGADTSPSNVFDDFSVKDVVCFFHQHA